ncbi:MAG: hypothetical protein LRY56_06280, partial [Burkholderiaceae bacterium]|nr:hypothetical protein [Burkholderiaceae bacterium]
MQNLTQRQKMEPIRKKNLSKTAGETGFERPRTILKPLNVYGYGVARNRLQQAAKRMGVPAVLTKDLGDADALITLRTYYRNRQRPIMDAEARGMPIFVLRANTVHQMEEALAQLFNLAVEQAPNNWEQIERETLEAIEGVRNGQRWVDLAPASSSIRR